MRNGEYGSKKISLHFRIIDPRLDPKTFEKAALISPSSKNSSATLVRSIYECLSRMYPAKLETAP